MMMLFVCCYVVVCVVCLFVVMLFVCLFVVFVCCSMLLSVVLALFEFVSEYC